MTISTAVGILTTERAGLIDSNVVLPTIIDTAQTRIGYFNDPAIIMDNLILSNIYQINTKKQQIVQICADAASIGTASTCGIGSTAGSVTLVYSSILTGVATTGIGTSVGFGTGGVIGFGTVRQDTAQGYYYPYLENGTAPEDNPFTGAGYAQITTGNVGIGKSTILVINDTGGGFIGTVVNITGPAGSCANYASSITSLISEIVTLRAGITSYVDAVTLLKEQKYNYQLEIWSYNRVMENNTARAAAIDTLIDILT